MPGPGRGPIEWLVVEFQGSHFRDEIAPEIEDLVERGLVRLLDAVIMKRDDDGTLDTFELADLDESEVGALCVYQPDLVMLLSAAEVSAAAEVVPPGGSAALLVWENTWAASFGSAVRRADGHLMASGRLPVRALRRGRPGARR